MCILQNELAKLEKLMSLIEHETSLVTDARTPCWCGLVVKEASCYALSIRVHVKGEQEHTNRTQGRFPQPWNSRAQRGENPPDKDSTRVSSSKLMETLAFCQAGLFFLLSHSKITSWESPGGHRRIRKKTEQRKDGSKRWKVEGGGLSGRQGMEEPERGRALPKIKAVQHLVN